MIERINWSIVFISFCIGLIIVYFRGPKKHYVEYHPTPENIADKIFKDKDDNCFEVDIEKTSCSAKPDVKVRK